MTTRGGRVRRILRWNETEYWQVWALSLFMGGLLFTCLAVGDRIAEGVVAGVVIAGSSGVIRSVRLSSRRETRAIGEWTPRRSKLS